MKIKITSACLHSRGTHASEGDVLDLPAEDASPIIFAGRGYAVPDDWQTTAEQAAAEAESAAKAEAEAAEAKAKEEAEAAAKAKAEADAAAKEAKGKK